VKESKGVESRMKLERELRLNPAETAVIIIDLQNACCSPKSLLARVTDQDTSLIEDTVERIPSFLDEARKLGVEVIWVISDYWRGSAPDNVLEAEELVFGRFHDTSKRGWGYEYYGPRPEEDEKEFVKTHPSVFQNAEFERYLEQKGIRTLIFTGVFTSRCVFCSLVGASERGYRCILVEDLVGNWVEKMFETKATLSIIHGMLGFVLDRRTVIESIRSEGSDSKRVG